MKWYPWLNTPYRHWVDQWQQGRAHNAMMLQALEGMGAESLVWAISRWLMCSQREGYKSCGKCHACRLMEAGTHPDWYAISPEKGKSTLGVDAIRTLTEKLYQHAQQGGARIVWFPDASLLTEASANALLKTVEEPPQNVWFIFATTQVSTLLATLRSRCQHWHLSVPTESSGIAWLNAQMAVTPDACLTALRLSGGAPVAALSLLEEKMWQSRMSFFQSLRGCFPGALVDLLPALMGDNPLQRVDWLCSLLMDALKWQQGGEAYISNVDQQDVIVAIASSHAPTVLNQRLQTWIHCRHRLHTVAAVNRELLLAECLLEWQLQQSLPPVA